MKKFTRFLNVFTIVSAFFLFATQAVAQTSITVGSGSNTSMLIYGTNFDNHFQVILTKAELAAAGLPAGPCAITSLGLQRGSGTSGTYNDFTVSMKNLSQADFGSVNGAAASFIQAPLVMNRGNFTTTAIAVYPYIFDTPFMYDGNSNVLIDICYNNSSAPATWPMTVKGTTITTKNPSVYLAEDNQTGCICDNPTGTGTQFRPNVVLGFTAPNYVCSGSGTYLQDVIFKTNYADHHVQMIIPKTQVQGSGWINGKNLITSIRFMAGSPSTKMMNNFTIKMKNVNESDFGLGNTSDFYQNLTQVYQGNYHAVSMWNLFVLNTPFYYDVNKNLLIDICFDNGSYATSTNVYCENTGAKTMITSSADYVSSGICDITTGGVTRSLLPNICFSFAEPPVYNATIGTPGGAYVNWIYDHWKTDHHYQIIMTKSELEASGLVSNNTIASISFFEHEYGSGCNPEALLLNYTIKLKNINENYFSDLNYIQGATQVYQSDYYSCPGWNKHNFSTPFLYSGNNLLIDICYDFSPTNTFKNQEYVDLYSTSGTNATLIFSSIDVPDGGICNGSTALNNNVYYGNVYKPVLKLTYYNIPPTQIESAVVVGNGTYTRDNLYNTAWDINRLQMIVTRNELLAAGWNPAKNRSISSIGFEVAGTPSQQPMNDLMISMKNVSFSTFETTSFIDNCKGVYWSGYNTPYIASSGWNIHNDNLSASGELQYGITPFEYDGIGNLLIEVSFYNYGQHSNSTSVYANSAYHAAIYYPKMYGQFNSSTGIYTFRPNVKLNFTELKSLTTSGSDDTESQSSITDQTLVNSGTLSVYPNPAGNNISIDGINDVENTTVSIYDMLGKQIINIPCKSKLQNIDISELPAGVYNVTVNNGVEISTKKFIKIQK